MASLTDTAQFSRKLSRGVLIGIGAAVLLLVILMFGKSIKSALFPPRALPATVAFGQLSRISRSNPLAAQVFSIDTVTGDLPVLPISAKVFAIAQPGSSFGAQEKVREVALRFGIRQEPTISGGIAQFVDPEKNITLNVDVNTGTFVYQTNFYNDPKIISGRPASVEEAVLTARSFFSSSTLDENEYPKDKVQTRLLKIEGRNLVETPSLASANIVQVNFGRTDIDKIPVVESEKIGLVSAMVSTSGVVQGQFRPAPIQKYKFATYPLKGVAKAYEDLKTGRGFSLETSENTNSIADIILAYVETDHEPQFLQPVYLFMGPETNIGYVPAIDEAWIR